MSSRTYTRNAFETQLNGAITAGATSFAVDSATGLSDPCYLVLEPDSPTLREYVYVGTITGTTFSNVTRGAAGSSSGAQAHASGAVVRAVFVHQMLDDIFSDVEALETADTNHFGGTDTADHPEATVSVRGFMSAADKTKLDGIAAGAKEDHGQLSGLGDDDHTQYLNTARHAAIDAADHGSGAATDGYVLTADGVGGAAWEVNDHGALTGLADDDHTQYHTDARALTWHSALSGAHVTNGDTHDHSGGDGAQIAHSGLSGLTTGNPHTQYALLSGASFTGDVDPSADNVRDLGATGLAWRNLYAHSIYDEGGSQAINTSAKRLVGGWDTTGHFLPSSAGTLDLGSAALDWRRLYVNAIYDESGTVRLDMNLYIDMGDGTFGSPSYRLGTNGGLYSAIANSVQVKAGTVAFRFSGGGNAFMPETDGGPNLGGSGNRWSTVYATTGTINTSDLREKVRLAPVGYGLDAVLALEPISFEWDPKLNRRSKGRRLGFGAQSIQAVIPEAVEAPDDGGPLGTDMGQMVAVLWQAVRELAGAR